MWRRLASGVALGFLVLAGVAAQAQPVLYSAFDANMAAGWCVDNIEHHVAVKFAVPATGPFDVTGIKSSLWFSPALPASNMRVDIFEWTQNDLPPATLVGSLTLNETMPPPDPDGDPDLVRHDYTFSAPQPVRLEAGRSYWVQFDVTSETSCVAYLGISTTAPTTSVLAREAEYQNWSGLWTDRTSSGYTQLEIYGQNAAIPASPVPVPATSAWALLLLAMGAAGIARISMRRGANLRG